MTATTIVTGTGTLVSWFQPAATLLAVVVGGAINIYAARIEADRMARRERAERATTAHARTVAALASLSTLGAVIRARRESASFEIPLGPSFFRHLDAQCARFTQSASDLHVFLDPPTVERLYDYFDTLAFMSATFEEVDRTSAANFLDATTQRTLKQQSDLFLRRGKDAQKLRDAVMRQRPGRH